MLVPVKAGPEHTRLRSSLPAALAVSHTYKIPPGMPRETDAPAYL